MGLLEKIRDMETLVLLVVNAADLVMFERINNEEIFMNLMNYECYEDEDVRCELIVLKGDSKKYDKIKIEKCNYRFLYIYKFG